MNTYLTGRNILVVEDSFINLKVVCQTLEVMGAHVFTAENGEEGVIAMNTELHAVLMDVEMPIMNGITATEIIRKNHQYDHIPIIATTAHAINEDKKRCFQAGMNDYMTKPLEPEVLLQILTRNIHETQNHPIGPIDYEAGIAKVGGDQSFFDEILQDFCELHGNEGVLLAKLFVQEKITEIGERAHRLKGVAGAISAEEFASKAKQLEELAKVENIDPVEIQKAILQVKECIEAILAEIDAEQEQRSDAAAKAVPPQK